jgi:hypothetical protein
MSTFRHTGVGNAVARTDYAAAGQVQDSTMKWGSTAGGSSDALTIALSPAVTAYVAGQSFPFISGATPNTTTTPTLAVNGLTVKTFVRKDGTALAIGDIAASTLYAATYDGTNMRLDLGSSAGSTSLVTVGTITTGTWNATVITGQYGGTGVANTGKTITLGGNVSTAGALTTSGAFASTFTMSGAYTYTFPGGTDTIAALGQAQTFTKAQRGAYFTLTDASTIALDLSQGNQFQVQLAGNRTLAVPTNIVAGHIFDINVYQDTTGSRTLAYQWMYAWFGSAGTLSTPGATQDLISGKVDAYNSATMTVTIAAPGVGTMTGHGFFSGQKCQITTTGALPTGLTASTTYFLHVIDANTFHFCTSLVNVAAGTYITTTGSQSGTHTLTGGKITLVLNKASA